MVVHSFLLKKHFYFTEHETGMIGIYSTTGAILQLKTKQTVTEEYTWYVVQNS